MFYSQNRLNLTPTMTGSTSQSTRSGTPSRRTPTRALKRKRTMLEESSSYSLADFVTTSSAKGEVEVEEVDSDGKFIRLINKSDKVVVFFQCVIFNLTWNLSNRFLGSLFKWMAVSAQGSGNRDHLQISPVPESGSWRHGLSLVGR